MSLVKVGHWSRERAIHLLLQANIRVGRRSYFAWKEGSPLVSARIIEENLLACLSSARVVPKTELFHPFMLCSYFYLHWSLGHPLFDTFPCMLHTCCCSIISHHPGGLHPLFEHPLDKNNTEETTFGLLYDYICQHSASNAEHTSYPEAQSERSLSRQIQANSLDCASSP
jgi:hypothetical protein